MHNRTGCIVGMVALAMAAVMAVPAHAAVHGEPISGGNDISVYRPSRGTWYSYALGIPKVHYGIPGDIPVPGFYTGAERPNIAVYRPSTGTWYIRGAKKVHYGEPGDVPVPAFYTGRGHRKPDIAVFRPATGTWYIRGVGKVQYGERGDIPVPADYNGDGYTDFAVFRPSNGTWYIRGIGRAQYGQRGDIPVPGRYTGHRWANIALFRPSNGTWYIRGVIKIQYGQRGDIPVPADYAGNGYADIALFRPSTGTWYLRHIEKDRFGRHGDVPTPGLYTGGADPYITSAVTGVVAKPDWTSVQLSWNQHGLAERTRLVIRRATGTVPPISPTSGTAVTEIGGSATGYSDQRLRRDTTYSYALFARSESGRVSPAATITVRTGGPGTIAGTVLAESGAEALSGVTVDLFSSTGRSLSSTTTDARGRYSIGGLRAGSYQVCFDATSASGGPSASGYADECYSKVPWSPASHAPASRTTPVTVRDAATTTVSAALTTGRVIAGTVTASTGGAPISGVVVDVFDSSGFRAESAATRTDGSYTVNRLPDGSYTVCFEAPRVLAGASDPGYLGECFDDRPWNLPSVDPPPSEATPVTVSADSPRPDVNASLATSGAVSGTVTAAPDSAPLTAATVVVFDPQQRNIAVTSTDGDGQYVIGNLPAGSYSVCVMPFGATGGSSTTGYAGECNAGVPWTSGVLLPPPGTTPVAVQPGSITPVDFAVAPASAPAGP